MNVVIIDCFAGISGDMTLAALIDCGVPTEFLIKELGRLNLDGWQLDITDTERNHIRAKQVRVMFDESREKNRYYHDIIELIDQSTLNQTIKKKAKAAFTLLGQAEAKIHGIPLEKIHFHEIGALDSIIDLIGSIIGFDYLKPEKIYYRPVPLGDGFTQTAHGQIPVPSPAALEVLEDITVEHRASGYEMTTPTGATLIKILATDVLQTGLHYQVKKTGFGAGTKQHDAWPNILRIISATIDHIPDNLLMLETNIDDMNPEVYPYLFDQLLTQGATDVFVTPVIMKKGRPGILLSVLTENKNYLALEKEIFLQTTTLGIRKYPVSRTELVRTKKTIETEFGMIKVKSVIFEGKELIRPEFEECRRLAQIHQISLSEVYRRIEILNND